LTFADDLRSFG